MDRCPSQRIRVSGVQKAKMIKLIDENIESQMLDATFWLTSQDETI